MTAHRDIGIVADDIVVSFPIYNAASRSLKRAFLHATTGGRVARDSSNRVTVCAVDNVSFAIEPGDRVGLIGHNGSGKTTLLRTLSGVYEPIYGRLLVRGRVASLLDLGLGIDPEATGYENIRLRAILAGLSPRQVESKLEEIADFSELDEYLQMPVRTYSSGMMLRLAFAVSTSVEADILLMDEWLSVGDAGFAKKAAARLSGLVNRTPIFVIASHDENLIARTCNRIFRLEHGKVVEELDRRTPGAQAMPIEPAPFDVRPAEPETLADSLLNPGSTLLVNATRAELVSCMPPGGAVAVVKTARGDFATEFLEELKPLELHLIDPWCCRLNGDGPDREGDMLYQLFQHRFAKEIAAKQLVPHRKAATEAATSFPDEYFDLVYTHGGTTMDACLADLRAFDKKVKPTGLICGQNYQTVPEARSDGNRVVEAVNRFVMERGYDFLALTFDGTPSYVIAKDRSVHADLITKLASRFQVLVCITHPERRRFEQIEVPYPHQQAKNGKKYIFLFD